MPIDLSTLDTKTPAERGICVELEHPFDRSLPFVDDDGKPYSITIMGGDAGKVRAKARKQLDQYLERLRKNRPAGDTEMSEQETIERLAAATLAWHLPPIDSKPAPDCNEKNARALYGDPRFPWIPEQLVKAMGDRSRFFTPSSSN